MAATAEPDAGAVAHQPPGPPAANQEPLAKVIPLHPRDILDRATSLESGFLSPPRPSRWAWLAGLVVLVLTGVGVLWSVVDNPQDEAAAHPDPESRPTEDVADVAPRRGAAPAISTPADMLTRARPELAVCARQCGGPLWVELATTADVPRFTSISVVCDGDTACARDVLDGIRFTPPDAAHTLLEEIRP